MTPVVFIHGLVGTLADPDLSHAFSGPTFAPDLLGYGMDGAVTEIDVDAQVAHLEARISERFGTSAVRLVGHSLGGVMAMVFAHRHPQRVAELVSVEGNFTLKDAFWSASIARMSVAEADAMLAGFRDDPAAWLARSGIPSSGGDPSDEALALARRWLARQPGATLRSMSQACIEVTAAERYLETVRAVFERHRVHLVAGERSRAGWDVPAWARALAASENVLPGTGHLMMIEDAAGFARAVAQALRAARCPAASESRVTSR